MTPTEAAFHRAMMNLYERSKKEIHYNATYFLRMLDDHGGVETAHRLLEPHSAVSDGFTTLVLEKRLDLSVEATVLKPEFQPLFTQDELDEARRRLAPYDWPPAGSGSS